MHTKTEKISETGKVFSDVDTKVHAIDCQTAWILVTSARYAYCICVFSADEITRERRSLWPRPTV